MKKRRISWQERMGRKLAGLFGVGRKKNEFLDSEKNRRFTDKLLRAGQTATSAAYPYLSLTYLRLGETLGGMAGGGTVREIRQVVKVIHQHERIEEQKRNQEAKTPLDLSVRVLERVGSLLQHTTQIEWRTFLERPFPDLEWEIQKEARRWKKRAGELEERQKIAEERLEEMERKLARQERRCRTETVARLVGEQLSQTRRMERMRRGSGDGRGAGGEMLW